MMDQGLPPGVEDGKEADPGTKYGGDQPTSSFKDQTDTEPIVGDQSGICNRTLSPRRAFACAVAVRWQWQFEGKASGCRDEALEFFEPALDDEDLRQS